MSFTSNKPTWSLSSLIANLKSIFHTKVGLPETITNEGIEETEPLIYEFEQAEEDGTNQTNTNETGDNDTDTTDENDAINTSKNNILGMICVAIGTGLFCSVGVIVKNEYCSLIQLMFGRVIIQNILSWLLWIVNPFQIRGNSMNWYGDAPYRVNLWIRGFLWFISTYLWWCGLVLIPIGVCYIVHIYTLNWCNN